MRIAVVGTTGSGKTTLTKALAVQLTLPYIELDALNWQAGWRDLSRTDPEEFIRRVTVAIAPEAWVLDGAYGLVRDLVWRRATHLIWLDYERRVIMYRVIYRSLVRATLHTEMWAGNRERWSLTCCGLLQRDEYGHLVVLRLRRPPEAEELLRKLRQTSEPSALTGFRAAS
jgi:adenylate kinase family enzyme